LSLEEFSKQEKERKKKEEQENAAKLQDDIKQFYEKSLANSSEGVKPTAIDELLNNDDLIEEDEDEEDDEGGYDFEFADDHGGVDVIEDDKIDD